MAVRPLRELTNPRPALIPARLPSQDVYADFLTYKVGFYVR